MNEQPAAKRAKGRPKKYKGLDGAPQVTVRLKPEVYAWLKERPEGLRRVIEDLVEERMTAERKKAPPE